MGVGKGERVRVVGVREKVSKVQEDEGGGGVRVGGGGWKELGWERRSLFVGCLTSQQRASVSQGRICSDNFTCCHT